MDQTALPPMPDPQTGEPRPPAAPLMPDHSPGERASPSKIKPFQPPPGQSPVLEWFQGSRNGAVVVALFVLSLMMLVAVLKTGGFSWASEWWMWVIIVPGVLLAYARMMKSRNSAGANWLMGRKGWVRTYELTRIRASRAFASITLDLTDAGDRHLYVKVIDLQRNPRVWDLVYNGILHSVHVNKAETNSLARSYLGLDP